jgi:hypothetical protein
VRTQGLSPKTSNTTNDGSGAYCIVVVPNFVLYARLSPHDFQVTHIINRRFARVENGECIIGMQRPAMIPLIVFDLVVNVSATWVLAFLLANRPGLPHHNLSQAIVRLVHAAHQRCPSKPVTLRRSLLVQELWPRPWKQTAQDHGHKDVHRLHLHSNQQYRVCHDPFSTPLHT